MASSHSQTQMMDTINATAGGSSEYEALREQQCRLEVLIQNLVRQQELQSKWLKERLSTIELLIRTNGIAQGARENAFAGIRPNPNSFVFNQPASSMRRHRRVSDSSRADTFADCQEQFASAATSVRWSDSGSAALSRQPSQQVFETQEPTVNSRLGEQDEPANRQQQQPATLHVEPQSARTNAGKLINKPAHHSSTSFAAQVSPFTAAAMEDIPLTDDNNTRSSDPRLRQPVAPPEPTLANSHAVPTNHMLMQGQPATESSGLQTVTVLNQTTPGVRPRSRSFYGRENVTTSPELRHAQTSTFPNRLPEQVESMAGSAYDGRQSRYLDNIPAMLRQAYEAETSNTIARESANLARTFPEYHQVIDLARQSAAASRPDGNLARHSAAPGYSLTPFHAQNNDNNTGLGRVSAATTAGITLSTGAGLRSHTSGTGLPAVHLTQTQTTENTAIALAGSTRAASLISDAPALLRKSFSRFARPSMQGNALPHPGDRPTSGDLSISMGYQGNALYVKSAGQGAHKQMLGDDEDPDRPLTRTDKARLLAFGLINPEGRTKWDLFIMVLLLWVCFASPLIVCFHLGVGLQHGDAVAIIEMIVDGFFVIDIILNFRTAYYDSVGNLVSNRAMIARHYVRSWFIYDLVSVVPFDLITEGMLGFFSMLKLLRVVRVGKVLRMLRMYRLMRVTRLPRILERVESYLDKGVLQIALFAITVGLLAHLSACLFHYMALLTYFITDTWEGTWVAAQGLVDANLAHRYVNSIYWAFTTVATVGYGDITPQNQKEKVLAILVMCSGVSLVGMVTSSITNIMAIRSAVSTKAAQKKQAVSDVLKTRQIPSALARRVRSFFNYESTKLLRNDEQQLLQDLPFKLRSRFLHHAYMDTLCRVPSFVRLRPDIFIDVISQLKSAYFVDGDIIALQGDLVTDMFFVHEGKLDLRVYDFPNNADPWAVLEAVNKDELAGYEYTIQGRMKKTYYFGQASAVHGGTWPCTVVARNCCELFALSREAMEGLAQRHPQALAGLLDVQEPPDAAKPIAQHTSFNIDLLKVEIDPLAIAADFPILDPPPRKRGLGHLLVGAVKGVGQGLANLAMVKHVDPQNTHGGDTSPLSHDGYLGKQSMFSNYGNSTITSPSNAQSRLATVSNAVPVQGSQVLATERKASDAAYQETLPLLTSSGQAVTMSNQQGLQQGIPVYQPGIEMQGSTFRTGLEDIAEGSVRNTEEPSLRQLSQLSQLSKSVTFGTGRRSRDSRDSRELISESDTQPLIPRT